MHTKTIDRMFAACLLVFGAYVVWNALAYGYTRGASPGPGFFPFWVGLALMVLSAVNILRSVRGTEVLGAEFDLAGLYKTLGLVATIAAFIMMAPIVGMLPGSGLFILATAFVIRPRWNLAFASRIIAIAVGFPIFCHFLFGVYLRVPLVEGVLGL